MSVSRNWVRRAVVTSVAAAALAGAGLTAAYGASDFPHPFDVPLSYMPNLQGDIDNSCQSFKTSPAGGGNRAVITKSENYKDEQGNDRVKGTYTCAD